MRNQCYRLPETDDTGESVRTERTNHRDKARVRCYGPRSSPASAEAQELEPCQTFWNPRSLTR